MHVRTILTALFFVCAEAQLARAEGELDVSYAAGGRQLVAFNLGGGETDQAFGTAMQPDGKLVVVGAASVASGYQDFAVLRLLPDGARDPQFGDNGRVTVHFDLSGSSMHNNVAHGVALQDDGKVVIVGTADGNPLGSGYGATSLVLVRLLPNGVLDSTFGTGGVVTRFYSGTASAVTGAAVAVLPDGGVVAVGSLASSTHSAAPYFLFLDNNGATLEQGYPYVNNASGAATAVNVDTAGRPVISGHYSSPSTKGYDCFVVRDVEYYDAGLKQNLLEADPEFGGGSGGYSFAFDGAGDNNDLCWGQAIDRENRIVLVGESTMPDSFTGTTTTGATITRVLADGSSTDIHTAWVGDGEQSRLRAVRIRHDGRIIGAGYVTSTNPQRAPYDFLMTQFRSNGLIDYTFVAQAPETEPLGFGIALGFEELHANALGEDDGAFALAVDAGDRVYLVGQAQAAGTDYDIAVARLASDEIFVDGFDPPLP